MNFSQPRFSSQNQLRKTMAHGVSQKKPTRFDLFVTKLTQLLMKHGKKTQATKLVWTTLLILKQKTKQDSSKKSHHSESSTLLVALIFQALESITPNLQVRKVRVSGTTYLVPSPLSKKKQENIALKWLIESAKKRKKNSYGTFSECLADEILEAFRKTGYARQKRDELHRLAQQNRAYIRYRWW